MGLIDQINKDIQQITGNSGEFGVEVTITSPSNISVTLIALHAKHHTDFNTDGLAHNTTIASVAVSEEFLIESGYPVRGADNEVYLKNHRVDVADSTGRVDNYVIREWFPDETIGLIVLILGKYAENN